MYPSRKAPSPPTSSFGEAALPLNHPFATYYIPPPPSYPYNHHRVLHHSSSEQSLDSSRYSQSIRSYKNQRSPTSSLAQPLSPKSSSRSSPVLGHFAPQPLNRTISKPRPQQSMEYGSAPHPAYSRSTPPSPTQSRYSAGIPTELTMFDTKPKQTLLGDVEYILGKKIHFPFLHNLTSSKSKKGKDEEEKKKRKRRLTKDRYAQEGWEWQGTLESYDLLPEDVVVVENRRGRGVREGNYI
ncbi:hypothetical protein I203_108034 [Kwoniella mangroviensis CBS 8507]|uniref:hypothetical protein n=1 Tax=Kwoniella mangroviensis CBS 8507 TaxID=1296122 RepID=UPI00080D5A9C|nr:uncharacterized protein I203_04928 [Kwoniella mangroviensis CBS 8507]OCF65908.1 hypothetical protein I203_04928 [Kwoniella mangroviensis CBS 8507]